MLAVGAAAAQESPRTITDMMGRQVTIDAPPERVVGLSASITEMLYAVGVTPVGATQDIDYPPAAASLPTFGTGYQLDLEALAALEPDLILANVQLQAQIAEQLEAIAPTVFVLILTPADIPVNLRLIGQATWHETTAEYAAAPYDTLMQVLQTAAPEEGPSTLIIVGTLGQPNFGKPETYLGSMVDLLGGTNVAAGLPDAGPFPGFAQLSIEEVLDADPDIILTITRGAPGATPIPEEMQADEVWSQLSAVQNGRVYELDNRLFLESPGPRFTQAILELYNLFYGEEM
jgi:iron complex transport system substrate-binding protein